MTTLAMHANLPWVASQQEDRRFRRILLQVLLVSLLLGWVMPYVNIPPVDAVFEDQPPPRRVRLLAEVPPPEPVPQPEPVIAPEEPAVVVPPAAEPAPVQAPVAVVETPRARAASSGVLAMSDALSALRDTRPRTGTLSGQSDSNRTQPPRAPVPSVLTADVTRGSQGVAAGVEHQSVLGSSGLPDREATTQGFSSGDVPSPASGRVESPSPAAVRSQAEIQEVLDRHKGAMYTLYNRALRENPALRGKLVMSIAIAPDGRVTRASVVSSELGAAKLEQQLVTLVKGIRFADRPGVPVVTTKIPVEFFPR